MRIKGVVLLVLLPCLGTALAMAVSGRDDTSPEVVGAVDKRATSGQYSSGQREPGQPAIRYDLSAIRRAAPDNIHATQLFQPKTWYSPPSPVPVNLLTPPPSSVPQLPFTFLGRMIDGNDVILFLSRNGRQYTVKVNDVVDDTYLVNKITNSNAVLTHLPTNIQQTLVFNSNAIRSPVISDAIPPAMTPLSQFP